MAASHDACTSSYRKVVRWRRIRKPLPPAEILRRAGRRRRSARATRQKPRSRSPRPNKSFSSKISLQPNWLTDLLFDQIRDQPREVPSVGRKYEGSLRLAPVQFEALHARGNPDLPDRRIRTDYELRRRSFKLDRQRAFLAVDIEIVVFGRAFQIALQPVKRIARYITELPIVNH